MLIKTKRLTLEPYGTKHYDTAVIYSTDPENTKMMCFLPCDSKEEVMEYLRKCEIQWKREKPAYLDAAILLDGRHIGAVSVEFLENGTVGELGWIIQKISGEAAMHMKPPKPLWNTAHENSGSENISPMPTAKMQPLSE